MKKILFIFIFLLSLISSGCFNYYPSRENPDSLKTEKSEYIKITKFYLKNGDSVDVKNYDVKYYKKYKNQEKVFVCIQSDDIHKNEAFSHLSKVKKDEKIIPSEQVKSISIEKRKTDVVGIVLVVTLSLLTVAALILLLWGLSLHSIKSFG